MNARRDDVTINTNEIDALLSGVGSRNQKNTAVQGSVDGTTAERQDGTTVRRQDGETVERRDGTTVVRQNGETVHRQTGMTVRRQDGGTVERRDGTTAAKPSTSKFTALLDEKHALLFDMLAYEMRSATGRRVEKSEILRTLIDLTMTDVGVHTRLGEMLDRRSRPSDPPSQG